MNETWIMNDKLMPVNLPGIYVPRPKLQQTFEKAASKPLVIVSAAAGCGKSLSTLLWLNESKRKYAWVSLDTYDNSLSVFYRLLCSAILSLQPKNTAMQDIYRAPAFSSSPTEHTVRLLAEFHPDGQSRALILDDMHTIENPEIRRSLPLLLKRLPKPFVTIVVSRNSIAAEQLKWLDISEIAYINADDLAFTQDETQSYLAACGHTATPEQSVKIHEITGGWPMGIQAVARSGQTEFHGEYGHLLDNYIRTQIWDKWSSELKEFLMTISITDDMDEDICNALTGRSDASAFLAAVSRACAFVSHVFGPVYRCHGLFLDFLREQAQESGLHTPPLHRTAAVYYFERRKFNLARYHAMRCDDPQVIIRTTMGVQNNALSSLDEYVNFYAGFNRSTLSKDICATYPFLYSSLIGQCFLLGDAAGMKKYLDQLYPLFPVIEEKYPQFIENTLGLFHLDIRISPLKQLTRFEKEWQRTKPTPLSIKHYSFTSELPFLHRSSRDYYEFIDESRLDLLKTTLGKLMHEHHEVIAEYLYAGLEMEQGKSQAAADRILPYAGLLVQDCNTLTKYPPEVIFSFYSLHAELEYSMHRHNAAAKWSIRAEQSLTEVGAEHLTHNLKAMRMRGKLWNGDLPAAKQWLNQYYVKESAQPELYKIYQHLATLRSYIALGQLDKAQILGEKLLRLANEFDRLTDAAEIQILLSIVRWALNQKIHAIDTLETALTSIQPYEFTRVAADEGNAILPILKRLSLRVKRADYSGELTPMYLNIITIAAHGHGKHRKGIAFHLETKPIKLSKGQKTVLTLLAQGYSRKEIAATLGVTPDTVKAHASVIYRKLGVHNAIDAVLRAQELGVV